MRLGDFDDLINSKPEFMNEKVVRDTKYRTTKDRIYAKAWNACNNYWVNTIDNAPTVEQPTGECRTCRHRDPEDKKCDCGGQERQGCSFPVSDDYFCKFYEKGGETNETVN